MYQMLLAIILFGVLGCGSEGDPKPSTPAISGTLKRQAQKPELPQIENLIADGKRLVEEEYYAAAIEAFTQAAQVDDRNAIPYRERARAQILASGYYARGTYLVATEVPAQAQPERFNPNLVISQTAREDLKTAILLDPSNAESHKLMGICLSVLGESDALHSFNESLRLDPNDPEAYYSRGIHLMSEVEFTKADADFTRAIELNPGLMRALMARSAFRGKTGNFSGALADLDAAIRLDETSYSAYLNRSVIHLTTGEYAKALADCTTAIGLDPNNADAYSNRGVVYLFRGEVQKAIDDLSKSIALDPQDYTSYSHRAQAHMGMDLLPKALADIDVAIEMAPNIYKLRIGRAMVLTKMDRPDEARESRRKGQWVQQYVALNQSVTDGPNDSQNYRRRAMHYAKDEQWKHAISDFNKALQLESDSVETMVERAKAWLAQGKFQKAIDDCNWALKHSTQLKIYSVRGDAYLGLEDHDLAIADYERAKRFDTQVAQAFLLRSKERKAVGETSAAEKDLQQAIAIDPSLSGLR